MSKFSPQDSFTKVSDLRLREVPEWGCLLVYTPTNPNVHYLDTRSWLIFELCDSRSYEHLLSEFAEAVPEGTEQAALRSALDAGLDSLLLKGIVSRVSEPVAGRPCSFSSRSVG